MRMQTCFHRSTLQSRNARLSHLFRHMLHPSWQLVSILGEIYECLDKNWYRNLLFANHFPTWRNLNFKKLLLCNEFLLHSLLYCRWCGKLLGLISSCHFILSVLCWKETVKMKLDPNYCLIQNPDVKSLQHFSIVHILLLLGSHLHFEDNGTGTKSWLHQQLNQQKHSQVCCAFRNVCSNILPSHSWI